MSAVPASSGFASNPAEARKEIRNYTMNFGPQHPAAHGVLRLVLAVGMLSGLVAAVFLAALTVLIGLVGVGRGVASGGAAAHGGGSDDHLQ